MERVCGWVMCLALVGCQQSNGLVENCGDTLDNDGDGATDCIDSDCAEAAECLNATPSTPSVHIEPQSPHPGQGLTCVVDQESTDEEGDALDYEFSWTVETADGVSADAGAELLWNEGEAYRHDTVLTGVTQPAEVWTCSLVVSDGTSASDPVTDSVTIGSSCSDLNCDGYPDIVFANFTDDNAATVDSYIYYGTATGYSENDRGGLPSSGASGVSVADLDNDGFQDIVFSNHVVNEKYDIESGIFWGSSTGHSMSDRTGLPTIGAMTNVVADVDGDGFQDLLFVNRFDGTNYEVDSYLYWGSAAGFSESNRLELPGYGGGAAGVADFNGDGHNDIVIAGFFSYVLDEVNTVIYFGSSAGIDLDDPLVLDSGGVEGLGIADLDDDGDPDLVLGGYFENTLGDDQTKIYTNNGTDTPFSDSYASLPSLMTYDVHIRDLNDDGYFEIVMANLLDPDAGGLDAKSYIYWGSLDAYSVDERTELQTFGATDVESADLDEDGYLDLVFSSLSDGVSLDTNGVIFWGGEGGYTDTDITNLDILGSFNLAIAGG